MSEILDADTTGFMVLLGELTGLKPESEGLTTTLLGFQDSDLSTLRCFGAN